jgi:hypothetical protein
MMKYSARCDSEREKLLVQIKHSFDSKGNPLRENIPAGPVDQSFEYAYSAEFFAGRLWTEIGDDELLNSYPTGVSAAVTFLSDQSFFYYLPLFMSCVLRKFDESDALAQSLLFDLMRPSTLQGQNQFDARFLDLELSKKKCVARFLKFLVECHAGKYPSDIYEASSPDISLPRYWIQFLDE